MANSDKIAANQNSISVVEISAEETSVCCRGANQALGHPAVYLDISGDQQEVDCYYCGRTFKKPH